MVAAGAEEGLPDTGPGLLLPGPYPPRLPFLPSALHRRALPPGRAAEAEAAGLGGFWDLRPVRGRRGGGGGAAAAPIPRGPVGPRRSRIAPGPGLRRRRRWRLRAPK